MRTRTWEWVGFFIAMISLGWLAFIDWRIASAIWLMMLGDNMQKEFKKRREEK